MQQRDNEIEKELTFVCLPASFLASFTRARVVIVIAPLPVADDDGTFEGLAS
jgi:hypothetical protein